MVATFYPPHNFGGDGMGIQRLSQALVRRGHRVTVVQDTDAYRLLSGGNEPDEGDGSDGVQAVRVSSRFPALSVLLTQQTGRPVVQGRKLRRILEHPDFDVITYHNISLVGGPGILSAGNALKIYMAHEHWLVCPSHVLWRHGRERCDSRQCLRCVLHYRRPPQLWRYTGFLQRQLKQVDAIIAMSEFSREKHREFGFSREMEVVNYFLPDQPTEARAVSSESPHPRPYFLFVGRLERIKGLDDVIPLFRNYPDADLLIAGDGEHGPVLRSIGAGITNVRFLGRLAPEMLDRYYRHALALIVPSVCYETFGIILIEAFRQSTPVLARRVGPFPEIVDRCGGGMLFDGPDQLEEAMRRIQQEPGLRDRLACAARQGFVDHWSEDAVVPRYLDVVRATAQATGRTRIVTALQPEGNP